MSFCYLGITLMRKRLRIMKEFLLPHFNVFNYTFLYFYGCEIFSQNVRSSVTVIWELNKGQLQNASSKIYIKIHTVCVSFFFLFTLYIVWLISSKPVLYFSQMGNMLAVWWFPQKPYNGKALSRSWNFNYSLFFRT